MARKKSPLFPRKTVVLSLALAIVTTFGLVGLTLSKKSVLNFSNANFPGEYVNLVLNPSFETDVNRDKVPDSWKKQSGLTKQDIIIDREFYEGSRSLRISAGKTKYYSQVINGNWGMGTTFHVNRFTKGDGVTDPEHTGEFRVTFVYQDGETSVVDISTPPGNHDWSDSPQTYTVDRDIPLTRLIVRLGSKAFAEGNYYFDYVKVFYVNPVPTMTLPSSSPLPTRRPSVTRIPTPTPARVPTPTIVPPTRVPTYGPTGTPTPTAKPPIPTIPGF